jgi:hypothetical protein
VRISKDTSKALIGVASGALLLAFKPGVDSAISTTGSLMSLGIELQRRLTLQSPESRRALARIRNAVRADFLAWAKVEGVAATEEIAAADTVLGNLLPTIFLARERVVAAAFGPGGFVRDGCETIVSELARADALFQERPGSVAHQYATVVVSSALRAVFTERPYFEALEPYFVIQMAQNLGDMGRKLERMLSEIERSGDTGGLSRAQVQGLLRAFSEEQVPEQAAHSLLLEKAIELRDLKARLQDIDSADESLHEGLAEVETAIDEGRYAEADAALSRLIGEGASSAARALSTTIELLCRRAELAYAQTRYWAAVIFLEHARSIALASNPYLAWKLLGAQIEATLNHAAKTPGITHYETAIALGLKHVQMALPNRPEDRGESVGQLITVIGLYAERADKDEGRRAVLLGLKMGREVLEELEAAPHGALMARIGNSLGALLNGAVAIGAESEDKDLCDEAVSTLNHAGELASLHCPGELTRIRLNLATAMRKKGERSAEPEPLLQEAIKNRQLAIAGDEVIDDVLLLSNAYDSLGNDYRSLLGAKEALERDIFFRGLSAYRRALRLRRRGSFVVDVAKTRLNLGGFYADAAYRTEHSERTRLLHLSIRHFEKGLHLVSQETAPLIWSQLVLLWAHVRFSLISFGEAVDDSTILELNERVLSFVRHAHRGADVVQLMHGAEMAFQISVHIRIQRRREALKAVADQVTAFKELLETYRYAPIAPNLEIWIAQCEFIIADVTNNLEMALKARRALADVMETFRRSGWRDREIEMEEILHDMDVVFNSLAERLRERP